MPAGVTPTEIHGYNSLGMPICNGNMRNKPGRRCQSTVLFMNGRCKDHGGNDHVGERIPAADRRAQIESTLPQRFRKVFNASVDSPNQLSMSLEIGLMDTNLARILEMLDGIPTPENWRKLKMVQIRLQRACDDGNPVAVKRCVEEFKALVSVGNTETEVWAEMQTSMANRAKIAKAEIDRLVASKNVVTVQEAEMIVATLFRVMADNIPMNMLQAVKDEFVKKMELPSYIQAIGPGELDNDPIPEAPSRTPDYTRNYHRPEDGDDE